MKPRPRFWNLPNVLTLCRMAAVPLMVWLLLEPPDPTGDIVAALVFVAAMVTDWIDGWLARRWDLVTPVGAYLDPLADKLMVATVLIMLIPIGRVPAWLTVLLLCREFAITGLRGIASQWEMVLSASTLGKFKTAYQSVALACILWHGPFLGINAYSAGVVLLWIATGFSLLSAAEYLSQFFRQAMA